MDPTDAIHTKTLKAVAIETSRDWAAYIGLDSESFEHVASYGEKLPQSVAQLIFPDIRKVYRQ